MKTIKSYKAFEYDWTCRGIAYGGVGSETSIQGELIMCQHGIHSCRRISDVIKHYPLLQSYRYAEIKNYGKILEAGEDRKICSSKIKILRELSFDEVLKVLEKENTGVDNNSHGVCHGSGVAHSDGVNNSYSVNSSNGVTHSGGVSFSNGVARSHGVNHSNGVAHSHGVNHSNGVEFSNGINNSYGVNSSNGVARSHGVNHSNGVDHSDGVNSSNGVDHSDGVNSSNGVDHSDGVNSSNGVAYSGGVSFSNGVAHSDGVNSSNGVAHSHGVSHSYGVEFSNGVDNSHGVSHSYGVKSSNGVTNALFLADKKESFSIFGKEVNEDRFNSVYNEINNLNGGWYPKFDNVYELYFKVGGNWEKTPLYRVEENNNTTAWADMPKETIDYIKSLPEFDANMFKKITGIDVNKEE